jgi:GNAT superfamily N-acetyltransferase
VEACAIERLQPGAWGRFRELRLRALAEAPDAFGRTLAEEEAMPPADWRARLESRDSATFIASCAAGDVGLVVGAAWHGTPSAAGLFAMWVAPTARGSGIGGLLVDAVVDWARTRGDTRLFLDVADANLPAIALYHSRGFRPNGVRGTLPPPRTHIAEHQLVLEL